MRTPQSTNPKPMTGPTISSPSPDPPTRKNPRPVSQNKKPSPRPKRHTSTAAPNPPSPDPLDPEKRNPVNQKQNHAARFDIVQQFIKANAQVFARQGTVAATWRTYKGKRLGPYYQLTYREDGRQHWLYLGRSEQLAQQVRQFLAALHGPRDRHRLNRRLQSQARASLHLAKAQLKEVCAKRGITLKGYEFRGVHKYLAGYSRTQPLMPPPPIRYSYACAPAVAHPRFRTSPSDPISPLTAPGTEDGGTSPSQLPAALHDAQMSRHQWTTLDPQKNQPP